MSASWNDFEELQALCDAVIEGRLTPEAQQRLEQLVLDHPEARRLYVEYLHQHASLRWSIAEPGGLATPPRAFVRAGRRRWRVAAVLLSVAALFVLGITLGLPWKFLPGQPPAPFARLVEGKACKWDGGSLPTEVGASLGTGRLRLAEGLARIVFDHGAEITVEAPADLELLAPRNCRLRTGRLMAKVSNPAEGFVVETPTAILTDFGTQFGVNVHDTEACDVQVFQGEVAVEHRASGRTERLRAGKNRRFGAAADSVADFNPLSELPEPEPAAGPVDVRPGRVVQLTTATGHGKDTYIQTKYPSEHHSDILMLVKYSRAINPDYERKAYMGFDLSSIAGLSVADARLSVTFAPTGMGYASEVPDATFAIFGLTDESKDGWDEANIRWNNAPANLPGGVALEPSKVVRLGTFEIVQGELSGIRSVEGPALADFLNRDTNGMATFILVRETQGSGRSDLVHGFANKNHPDLSPPTLRLVVTPRGP